MEKVVAKFKLGEQPSDFAYWQTRTVQERIDALEQIRSEYHRWRYGAEPRLQSLFENLS